MHVSSKRDTPKAPKPLYTGVASGTKFRRKKPKASPQVSSHMKPAGHGHFQHEPANLIGDLNGKKPVRRKNRFNFKGSRELGGSSAGL